MELIVTDLTRFKNKDILCMAALTFDGQQCIRPMRNALPGYLRYDECKRFGVLPGTILTGEFTPTENAEAPHIEDHYFSKMSVTRMATASEFYNALSGSASTTFDSGFGLSIKEKVVTEKPNKSIFTLKIPCTNFKIVRDKFNPEKIKAHITDTSGKELSFLSVTDLGLADFIGNPNDSRMSVDEFNEFTRSQDELFLRIGLSRSYSSENGKSGYWIQVNGVYTFPNYTQIIRTY